MLSAVASSSSKKVVEPSSSFGKRSTLEESLRLKKVVSAALSVSCSSLLTASGWMRKSGMKSSGRGGRKKFSIGGGSERWRVRGSCVVLSVPGSVYCVGNSRLYVDQQQKESRAMPRRYS